MVLSIPLKASTLGAGLKLVDRPSLSAAILGEMRKPKEQVPDSTTELDSEAPWAALLAPNTGTTRFVVFNSGSSSSTSLLFCAMEIDLSFS